MKIWETKRGLGLQINFVGLARQAVDEFNIAPIVKSPHSGGWSWSGVREKYYYLAGDWRLELEGWKRDSL